MSPPFFVVFLPLALSSLFVNVCSQPSEIVFGQSCALTGAVQDLGTRMQAGIRAAFDEVNRNGGVRGGMSLRLITYDDQYEPTQSVIQTNRLLEQNVFGLIGYVGTAPSQAVIPIAVKHGIPYIGPFSGAGAILRQPYTPEAVNLRISYWDETAAMANLLVGTLRLQHIVCIYQNDGFGQSGFDGITTMLQTFNMQLAASSTFIRNTVDIMPGLWEIANKTSQIEAVVLVATSGPAANFVKAARKNPSFSPSCIFVAMSIVGSEAFRRELGGDYKNVLIMQNVPVPTDTRYALVRSYQAAMTAQNDINFDFVSLEGYVAGRFTAQVLKFMPELTPSSFLKTIQDLQIVSVEDMPYGLFGGQCDGVSMQRQNTICECNQGSRRVWTTFINETTQQYELVPNTDFQYPATQCAANPTLLKETLAFGMIHDGSKTSDSLQLGVTMGFQGVNKRGGAAGINIQLVSQPQQSVGTTAEDVTRFVENNRLAGLLCSKVPLSANTPTVIDPWYVNPLKPLSNREYPDQHFLITTGMEDEIFVLVKSAFAQGEALDTITNLHVVIRINNELPMEDVQKLLRFVRSSVLTHTKGVRNTEDSLTLLTSSNATWTNFPMMGHVLLFTSDKQDMSTFFSFANNTAQGGGNVQLLWPTSMSMMFDLPLWLQPRTHVVTLYDRAWNTTFTKLRLEMADDAAAMGLNINIFQQNPWVLRGYMAARVASSVVGHRGNRSMTPQEVSQDLKIAVFPLGTTMLGPFEEICDIGVCGCSLGVWTFYVVYASKPFAPLTSHSKLNCELKYYVTPVIIETDNTTRDIIISTVVCGGILLIVAAIAVVWYRTVFVHRNAPRGGSNVAIMFTDIESSSDMWSSGPEYMGDVIDTHHAIIRRVISKYNGYEVKTIGDAFMIACRTPLQALQIALDVQTEMMHQEWPSFVDQFYEAKHAGGVSVGPAWKGLRVRIGMHFGEATGAQDPVTKRFDYYGHAVNLSARVESSAAGGQVLCTSNILDSVSFNADGKQPSLNYVSHSLGKYSLKGIGHPVEIYQLTPACAKLRVYPPLKVPVSTAHDATHAGGDRASNGSSSDTSDGRHVGIPQPWKDLVPMHPLVVDGVAEEDEVLDHMALGLRWFTATLRPLSSKERKGIAETIAKGWKVFTGDPKKDMWSIILRVSNETYQPHVTSEVEELHKSHKSMTSFRASLNSRPVGLLLPERSVFSDNVDNEKEQTPSLNINDASKLSDGEHHEPTEQHQASEEVTVTMN